MNKKTAITMALALGVLIGFFVTMIYGFISAPDTKRIMIPASASPTPTGVTLSEKTWERLEELLDETPGHPGGWENWP